MHTHFHPAQYITNQIITRQWNFSYGNKQVLVITEVIITNALVTINSNVISSNEPSGSIKRWEVLEWLHNWHLLKKASAP
jgi:hypothetical protein